MNRIFLVLFYIFFSTLLYSQQRLQQVIVSKNFGTEEGLSTKTIYSIAQDQEGFMWFGTDAGAFRYDGNSFKRYTVENGLSDNEVFKLHVDSLGRVWFLTYNGYLSFYHKGKFFNRNNAPFLRSTYTGGSYMHAVEDKGKIWFSSFKKGIVTVQDTIVTKIMIPVEDRYFSYPFLTSRSDTSLWFFRLTHLVNIKNRDSVNIGAHPSAYCSIEGISDVLYLTAQGIYRLRNGITEPFIISSSLPDYSKVVNIFYDKKNDNLWVCTLGKGCYLFHDRKFVRTYLPNSAVTGVSSDTEGNYWFSTLNEGVFVYYVSSIYIRNYDKSSGLSDNKVYSVAVDEKGNIWTGFYNAEVNKISGDNVSESYKLYSWNNADYLRTLSIVPIGDTIWFGNDGGIYFIANGKVGRVRYPDRSAEKNNYSVKHLMKDEDNNVYGSFSFNLLKVDKSGEVYSAIPVFDTITRIFSSVKAADGRLFVSTISGLIECIPGKHPVNLDAYYDFSQLRILDMKLDKSGELIMATNVNGVFIMKDRRVIQHITTSDQLTDNSCRKLFLEDSILYIGTQTGLNLFVKTNGRWIFKDEIQMRDGLPDNVINDIVADDSLIYIATDGGLCIVNKKIFHDTHFLQKIYFSEIVLDKPIQIINNSFSFESTVPNFIIKFAYPVFNPSNRASFRYRLHTEKDSVEWINTNNNEIQFSSLDPGVYYFDVIPNVKSQYAKMSSLKLEVLPMWWQTVIARITFFGILLLLTFILIRQWTKVQYEKRFRVLRQNQLIERERNRIASDMHDDIGADLTQISIWSNVLKGNTANTRILVDRISKLSNDVLSKMDQIIWALNSVHNHSADLVSYIHSYSQEYCENNNIELLFNIEEEMPDVPLSLFQRRNIFLVIKELLHNTVKHSSATSVEILISFVEQFLVVNYKDNGKGFIIDNTGDGMGLKTTVDRMEEIDSSIQFKSNLSEGMNATLKIHLSDQKTKI